MTRVDAASLRLERRAAAFVARHEVLRHGERALLLVSGGADSMAMLDVVAAVDVRLGLELELGVLHVDYATRGADSLRDRRLVQQACRARGLPCHVVRLRSRLQGGDFQARARELRYRRAREVAAADGYDAIVTAHNRDDQAETIVYRLAKYATPRGLVGMRPRDGVLARPLLGLGGDEIRAYCRRRGIEYGDDVTNLRPVYARNRLRLEVLPLLRELNPRVAETLSASALQAAAEADVLDAVAAEAQARVGLPSEAGDLAAVDLAALAAEPPALRALLVHRLVRQARGDDVLVERRVIEAVLALTERQADDGRVDLGAGIQAVRERGRLRIRVKPAPHHCTPADADLTGAAAAGGGESPSPGAAAASGSACSRAPSSTAAPMPTPS